MVIMNARLKAALQQKSQGKKKTILSTLKKKAGEVKGGIKAAKNVAASAYRLGKQVANPKNLAKSITGKGIVLPGSNYIGPGNLMPEDYAKQGKKIPKPTSAGDKLALQHDYDYGKYEKAGEKRFYTHYSDADDRALKASWKEVKKSGDAGALAVAGGMLAKKVYGKLTGKKRLRDREVFGHK